MPAPIHSNYSADFQKFVNIAANNIANGEFSEGLDRQVAVRLEDQAGSHMTHLAVLKDALGRALGNPGGAGLVPYGGDINADEISGPAIFDDLLSLAAL